MSHAAWTHNTQTVFNKGAQLAYYERRAAGTVDRQRDEGSRMDMGGSLGWPTAAVPACAAGI